MEQELLSEAAKGLELRLGRLSEEARAAAIGDPRRGVALERHTAWILCVSEDATMLAAPMDPKIDFPQNAVVIGFGWLVIDVIWHEGGEAKSVTLQAHPSVRQTKHLESLFLMLADFARAGHVAANRAVVRAILTLIGEELRDPTMRKGDEIDIRRHSFYKVRAFVIDHLGKPFQLTDVAEATGLSGNYVNKLSRSFTGMRFTEFLNFARLERARHLLIHEPKRSGREVADACGFGGFGYFVRKFRLAYGMPPMQMRRRCLRRGGAPDASVASRLCGFAELEPEPTGALLLSEEESLPQFQLMIINLTARAVTVHGISQTGELETLGIVTPGGRWPLALSAGECVALTELDGSLLAGYRMPASVSQIFVPQQRSPEAAAP